MSKKSSTTASFVSKDEELLVAYFKKNNRPFSPQQIELAHPQYGKTRVTKMLKLLADQGKIVCKESGKSLVYWMDQKDELDEYGQPVDGPKPRPDDVTRQNTALRAEREDLDQQLKSLQAESKQLEAQLTDDKIDEEIERLTKDTADMSAKLKAYKSKNTSLTADSKKTLEANHAKARREWINRRRMFKEVLDTVLERSSKKRKDLQEEVGWETDEDLNITLVEDRSKKSSSSSTSSSSSAPEYKRPRR
ncbi:hypothetical protein SAMD00019534_017520 [Acytostelium subglobosum LB1]|uniref:hypothetical protein n=1 Tax=Acytostelium subglobosum LB1 TaxID=1410327 RepID=UPI000644B929|nr:hypothetical protein SAMD00019534_017520 [Acytostelium subglobosum LB1]GAM18577.1 hypothetical protein SAMD00019534_017520 [Acytostelium subglobosum LB1]|eukprot:XP_012757797.1 hypothetical protein SAMD00019534_017520 [Acytostelium subglobosum LB1]